MWSRNHTPSTKQPNTRKPKHKSWLRARSLASSTSRPKTSASSSVTGERLFTSSWNALAPTSTSGSLPRPRMVRSTATSTSREPKLRQRRLTTGSRPLPRRTTSAAQTRTMLPPSVALSTTLTPVPAYTTRISRSFLGTRESPRPCPPCLSSSRIGTSSTLFPLWPRARARCLPWDSFRPRSRPWCLLRDSSP